jgi:hypothetical protein
MKPIKIMDMENKRKLSLLIRLLLWMLHFKLSQYLWNKTCSKLRINLWAMKNNNGKMCLFKFNLGEPTWERIY